MSSSLPPIVAENPYRMSKWGFYGELGHGANIKVRFIQTVMMPEEIDDLTLISNIPGSEKWDVRDLFQRDVDYGRVQAEIIPYLKDDGRVKFFNPLTLVVLPMDANGKDVLKEIEYVPQTFQKLEGIDYDVLDKKGYYQLRIMRQNGGQYAELAWNKSRCHLVAIDGQHRLSALKRIKNTPADQGTIAGWRIPVVILSILKLKKEGESANLLEVVRKTFVYINTQAVRVNAARKILLNDESVNAICAQEIVQASHSNDNLELGLRDPKMVPLLFWDWRGETEGGKRVLSPAAVKDIEELHSWMGTFIFGEDGSSDQEIALGIADMVPRLDTFGTERSLTYADAGRIREQFRKLIMPGFMRFMEEFGPFKSYIEECYKLERASVEESDIAQHAFVKLRFGTHNADPDLHADVQTKYEMIVDKIEGIRKKCLPELIAREIGMRGVVFSLACGKKELEEVKKKAIAWTDFVSMCLPAFDAIHGDGWFSSHSDMAKKQKELLTHVVFDASGAIINYKLEQIEDGVGSFLLILLFRKMATQGIATGEDFEEIWGKYADGLRKTIERGYKKEFRASLKDSFKGTAVEFARKVSEKAAEAAEKRMTAIKKYFLEKC